MCCAGLEEDWPPQVEGAEFGRLRGGKGAACVLSWPAAMGNARGVSLQLGWGHHRQLGISSVWAMGDVLGLPPGCLGAHVAESLVQGSRPSREQEVCLLTVVETIRKFTQLTEPEGTGKTSESAGQRQGNRSWSRPQLHAVY